MKGETTSTAQSLNSSSDGNTDVTSMKMIPFPGSVEHNCPAFEAKTTTYLEPMPLNTYYNSMDLQLLEMPSLPSIPHLQTELPFPQETQELIDRLDSGFFSPFVCADETAFFDDRVRLFSSFSGGTMSGETRVKREDDNHATPDSFFDDFPTDMFDEIEPLPSPFDW